MSHTCRVFIKQQKTVEKEMKVSSHLKRGNPITESTFW